MIEALESYLGNRYSPDTIRNFLGQAARYLAFTQHEPMGCWDKSAVIGYTDHLISQGLTRQSIQTNMGGVRALFRATGHTWPLAARELHIGLPAGEQEGPTLTVDEVARLIAGARAELQLRGKLGQTAAAVTALSTLYGFRSIEIAKLLNLGLDGYRIELQTAKAGRVRRHEIPASVSKILTTQSREYTRDGLHQLFRRMMARYVRPARPKEGWHALRRSLVTALLTREVPEVQVFSWMGWHRQDMTFRYYRPGASLDSIIWEKHPYLHFWD